MKLWHILAVCALVFIWKNSETPTGTMNKSLPAFSLRSLDNATSLDSSMIQGQVTMVTFFSGWCGYCKAQMAVAADMKRQFPQMRMIGIIYRDTAENAQAMLSQHGNPFDQVYLDFGNSAAQAMRLQGVPDNYLIDAKGKIRYHLSGAYSAAHVEQVFAPLLNQLASET